MDSEFLECSDFLSFSNAISVASNTSFSAIHVNIRSIRKYWEEFKIVTGNVQTVVDAFILTEIGVKEEQMGQFTLPGYNTFYFTRPRGGGGGIAVFIKQIWSAVKLPISFNHAEVVALYLDKVDFSITLLSVYRPPSNSVIRFIDELQGTLEDLNPVSQICLIGDININILQPSKSSVCDYLNVLAHFGLASGVNVPTREELLDSRLVSSCLDHVHIRLNESTAKSVIVLQKLADHYFIGCQVIPKDSKEKTCSSKATCIEITDNGRLDDLISSFDWDHFLGSVETSNIYSCFVDTFLLLKKKCKKVITVKKRKSDQPWLDKDILEAINYKEYLWSRCRRSPKNSLLKDEFKMERNRVNALIRSARRNYYRKRFSDSRNIGTTWSIANELRGVKPKKRSQDAIVQGFPTVTQQVVDDFNTYFARFSGNEVKDNSVFKQLQKSTMASAFLPTLTEFDLYSILFSFNRKKSPGFDGITVRDLCRNFESLKYVLLSIINGAIESGEVPTTLKIAIVKPLYKGSGNRENLENYRPISILPCISQILEKHLFITMTNFLEKFHLISPHQYGFRSGRGTQTLLDNFSDLLYNTFENNSVACALFLDLEKAFDTISHKLLYDKLENIGFRGPFLRLFKSFFSGRSQMVILENVKSRSVELKAGVPQGSVLSPLLFNIYVNDLSRVVTSCHVYQYADDTVLVSNHLNFIESMYSLQRDVSSLMDWFKGSAIKVNINKTKLVCFHNPLKLVRLDMPLLLHGSSCTSCDCIPIPFVNTVRYLGVLFDFDLSWNSHLSYVCTRLRKVSCCLYSIRSFAPRSVRKLILNGLAYSILRYGVTVYAHCSETWHKKVDALLKSMLKSVSYGSTLPEGINLFHYLQLPNFETLFKETVILKYYWDDSFKTVCVPSYSLRQSNRFLVPDARTRYGRCVREFYVPRTFNELPVSCINSNSIAHLKKSLKSLRG